MKKFVLDRVEHGVLYIKCLELTPTDAGGFFAPSGRFYGGAEVFDDTVDLLASYINGQKHRVKQLEAEIERIMADLENTELRSV